MFRALTLVMVALVLAPGASASEQLPTPPQLEPNVRFWTRIYTETDGRSGLIHDSEQLDVVYEVVHFPKGISTRSQERQVERAKSEIRDILKRLAHGKRTALSDEETRVLARWPEGVTDSTLRQAASRLRFQLGQADKFRAGLVRAGVWRPHIEERLREHAVPVELAALPHVESSYNPKAYSRIGAAGLWQFTRSTGARYMRVDNVVDERLDPYKATVAAARLLRDNYRRLGAWPLAITAYNHGAAGIERAARTLGTRDIGAIASRYKGRTFGFASRNFYASFLAASGIDRDPERYFGSIRPAQPVEYETVELPHYYPVDSLVRALGIDREVLQDHNLALRPAVWSGSKYVPRGYDLRVPKDAVRVALGEALERVPESQRLAYQHRDRFHKVQRGETLSKIASSYQVGQNELVALNNLRSRNSIRAGQVLILPDLAQATRASAPPANGIYEVQRGDTLSRIASRFSISEGRLAALNGLSNRHQLGVGQQLRLDAAAELAAPAPAAEPVAIAPPAAEPVEIAALAPAPEPEEIAAPAPALEPEEIAAVAELAPEPETAAAAAKEAPLESPEPRENEAALAGRNLPLDTAELVASLELAEVEAEEAPAGEPEALAEDGQLALDEPATAAAAPAPALASVASPLVPDPSDYTVTTDHGITVQADETLGHYAEWLDVRANTLRRLNRMRGEAPVVIGRKVKLDFSRVNPETFERRRLEYHQTLQEEFYGSYAVSGTYTHVVRGGESLWYLAQRKYSVPVWLLRQYNPDLDFGSLQPGNRLVVPRVEARQG